MGYVNRALNINEYGYAPNMPYAPYAPFTPTPRVPGSRRNGPTRAPICPSALRAELAHAPLCAGYREGTQHYSGAREPGQVSILDTSDCQS
jgi:hypothetical protein